MQVRWIHFSDYMILTNPRYNRTFIVLKWGMINTLTSPLIKLGNMLIKFWEDKTTSKGIMSGSSWVYCSFNDLSSTGQPGATDCFQIRLFWFNKSVISNDYQWYHGTNHSNIFSYYTWRIQSPCRCSCLLHYFRQLFINIYLVLFPLILGSMKYLSLTFCKSGNSTRVSPQSVSKLLKKTTFLGNFPIWHKYRG